MYSIFAKLLKDRGFTVADVSRATGINESTFSNWKRRQNRLSAKNAEIVARFFGVSVDYLMTGRVQTVVPSEDYNLNSEVIQLMAERPDIKRFVDEAKDADPEDVQTALDMLLSLKRKSK